MATRREGLGGERRFYAETSASFGLPERPLFGG